MEIQSEEFRFNLTLSIEVITCEYHDKYFNDLIYEANLKMNFLPHLSNDSAHNSATTCEHINILIRWMYEVNCFIKDGII